MVAAKSAFYLFIFVALRILLPSSGQQAQDCANNTINNFWHDAIENCQLMDVNNALEILKKLTAQRETDDQFIELLKLNIENSLKDLMVQEIVTMISLEQSDNEHNFISASEDFTENYKHLMRFVWSKALEELAPTMDIKKLIQQIVQIRNVRLKNSILQYIWQKFDLQYKNDLKFQQIMTFAFANLLKDSEHLSTTDIIQADAVLKQLPAVLVTIYQAWNYNVSFVNHQFSEYLFGDSDKGPLPQQRFLFTYIQPKTNFNIQGKFKLHFNRQGQIALSSIFQGFDRFLMRDNNRVYFCLDCDEMNDDDNLYWWNIVMASEHQANENQAQYIYLQSPESENLLCATSEYDQYRRWVEVVSIKDPESIQSCQWKVIKKKKKII